MKLLTRRYDNVNENQNLTNKFYKEKIMRKSANTNYVETTIWNNKDIEPGSSLEGRYISSDTFIGKFGETTKYIIEKDGTSYGIYETASLKRQFAKIPEGSYVWITYKGTETSKNGRQVKVYEVDYDTEA